MALLHHLLNRSLAHVIRFSSWPGHFSESVAEHSFFTAYFTSLIVQALRQNHYEIDGEKAITMALVHDMEETFSGDILSPFKNRTPELKSAIRQVNQETIHLVFQDLPERFAQHYISLWNEEGRGESIEAQIVKIADRLSLLSKCAEEVKTGNQYFGEIYTDALENLQQYEAEWWQDIKEEVLSDIDPVPDA